MITALPPRTVAREAVVIPQGVGFVVSISTLTVLGSMPVTSQKIWIMIVENPCPISVKPVLIVTVPSGLTVTIACPDSRIPLPIPTFLIPQAIPAYFDE